MFFKISINHLPLENCFEIWAKLAVSLAFSRHQLNRLCDRLTLLWQTKICMDFINSLRQNGPNRLAKKSQKMKTWRKTTRSYISEVEYERLLERSNPTYSNLLLDDSTEGAGQNMFSLFFFWQLSVSMKIRLIGSHSTICLNSLNSICSTVYFIFIRSVIRDT